MNDESRSTSVASSATPAILRSASTVGKSLIQNTMSLAASQREKDKKHEESKKRKSVDLGDGVELTEEMIAEFKECFALFDKSGDGSVSAEEVGVVMSQLGRELSPETLQELVQEVDKDGSGELEFPEFIQLMARQMREGVEDCEFKDMFVMLSGGSKFVSVVAVRSMLYKLACQNTDQSNQVTVSELAELMEEALDVHSPDDEDIMTYSQFKKMMEFSGI